MATSSSDPHLYPFLNPEVEVGRYIGSIDWSNHSLGPIVSWPQSLQTALSLVLYSPLPMALVWGPERTWFYNDAFRPIFGQDNPLQTLGHRFETVWPEHWHALEPLVNHTFGGEQSPRQNSLPVIQQPGQPTTHWTLRFSPIITESGKPGGILLTGTATTDGIEDNKQRGQELPYRVAESTPDKNRSLAIQAEQDDAEEQARLAVESAEAGTFFIDLVRNKLTHSPTLAKIFTGNAMKGLTRDAFITYILPQDRLTRAKAYEEAAHTGKIHYEARTVWDDGSIHWVTVAGTYLNDSAGQPTRFAGIVRDTTAEIEARLEQQQFTSLVEGSPEYMSIASLEGPMLYVNPYGLELLGLKREEVASKNLGDFFTPEDWKIVLHNQIPLSISQKRWQGVQHYRHFQTGERIPLSIKRFVIDDPITGKPYAIVATGHDLRPEIAAQKELEASEEALQKVNQRLEMALNAGRLGSYELYLASGILQCTPQCKANFGVAVDAPFNYPDLLRIILPDDRPYVQQAVDSAIANQSVYSAEYRILWSDGSIRWIRASGQATYDQIGTPLAMVGITMDITTQRIAQQDLERQVQERTRELITNNQALVRTNHELEQFAYIASHDLQEPLRKIQSFAGLLPDNRYNDESFALYLDKIMKSAQRMSALIKAVLNYSRLSKDEELFSKTDLTQIVHHVLADFELLIDEKKAVIRLSDLPLIEGIPMQLQQLFSNLISNALKFSQASPQIIIDSQPAQEYEAQQLGLQPSSAFVHVTVKDNGIGFDQQYADRVFTIFQRLNNAREYSGTGIGLALCRKIVSNHGGIITAESKLGQGATFHIYLPVSQSVQSA